MITLIAAMDRNGVIGDGAKIPWKLPGDMRHFRETTMGKAVIMGRKTWDTLGKPLPGRTNIVMSHSSLPVHDGVLVATSAHEAIGLAKKAGHASPMVIGGSAVYREFIEQGAERMILTVVDTESKGDIVFPYFDRSVWGCMSYVDHNRNDRDPYDWTVFEWRRRSANEYAARERWITLFSPRGSGTR